MNFMKTKIKILLILNKNKKKVNKIIINLMKKKFKFFHLKYDDNLNFFNKPHSYDYTISFLSKKILKKKFLNYTKFYNINFHPGPPKYPGIGCYNFALFNNEKTYGVTAHEINEKIDNGKIIKTKYFKISKNVDLCKIIELSYKNLIIVYKDVIKMIRKNNVTYSGERWKRKAFSKKDLDKASEIKSYFSKKKIHKILKCFYFEGKPSPYIKVKDVKFFYIKNKSF